MGCCNHRTTSDQPLLGYFGPQGNLVHAKSTLMKYLNDQDETRNFIRERAGKKTLYTSLLLSETRNKLFTNKCAQLTAIIDLSDFTLCSRVAAPTNERFQVDKSYGGHTRMYFRTLSLAEDHAWNIFHLMEALHFTIQSITTFSSRGRNDSMT